MEFESDNKDCTFITDELPSDVIIDIISYLDNIDDFKNCMLISKEIRDMIFKTPKIMRKICYKFDEFSDQVYNFVNEKGSFIRCVNLDTEFEQAYMLLCQMPNLEELSYYYENEKEYNSPIELRFLKKLQLYNCPDEFILDLKGVINLETFKIDMMFYEHPNLITNFIAEQSHLKEIQLDDENFPSRDISEEVGFKLKSLTIKKRPKNEENFIKFLKTQAESLEYFEYMSFLNFELCQIILEKFKILKTLIIDSIRLVDDVHESLHPIYNDSFSDWKLDTVKYFKDQNCENVNLQSILMKFPCLETLICSEVKKADGIFESLIDLEVESFNCEVFRNSKFPRLKNLRVLKIEKSEVFGNWMGFVKKFPKIENIYFEDINQKDTIYFLNILRMLKELTCLKTFQMEKYYGKINHIRYVDKVMGKSEFCKVKIIFNEKVVKILHKSVINVKCKEIYDFLKEDYKNYKFEDWDSCQLYEN